MFKNNYFEKYLHTTSSLKIMRYHFWHGKTLVDYSGKNKEHKYLKTIKKLETEENKIKIIGNKLNDTKILSFARFSFAPDIWWQKVKRSLILGNNDINFYDHQEG